MKKKITIATPPAVAAICPSKPGDWDCGCIIAGCCDWWVVGGGGGGVLDACWGWDWVLCERLGCEPKKFHQLIKNKIKKIKEIRK